jgi:hypothetical protein
LPDCTSQLLQWRMDTLSILLNYKDLFLTGWMRENWRGYEEAFSNKRLKKVTTNCPWGSKTVQQAQILPPATKLFILKQLHIFGNGRGLPCTLPSSEHFHGWSHKVYWRESKNGARTLRG